MSTLTDEQLIEIYARNCDCEGTRVIKLLVECARMAFFALDDSEERDGDDGREHVVGANNFDALCNALDALEELPEHDDEMIILTGPLKAEYLLRKLLAASQTEVQS